jgi:transposase InsO family protein
MGQLHKRFTDEQVKDMLQRYLKQEIEGPYIRTVLGLGKTQFFKLLTRYRAHPATFSIQYTRRTPPRHLDPGIEQNILNELTIDQRAIQNPQIPLRSYNYSYVQRRLQTTHHQQVSLSTIIDRAKQHGFYLPRRPHKAHDREVLTRYVGELIQHDASQHLWAPAAQAKWYLITSLDDFSRYLFFAQLVAQETVWQHIDAVQRLVLRYGYPYAYYVDCHAIFRFVRGRDAFQVRQTCLTDDVDPQWKQMLRECGIKPVYALSPQAKGKIERPYRWLQDHLVRTCVREDITSLTQANQLLAKEVHDYNHRRVHSTTGEIPYRRFQRALQAKQSLFRPFALPPPFQSAKDLFCFRLERTTNAYRRISLDTLQFSVRGVNPYQPLTLRISPRDRHLAEVRFWHEDRLVDVQTVKIADLKSVHF